MGRCTIDTVSTIIYQRSNNVTNHYYCQRSLSIHGCKTSQRTQNASKLSAAVIYCICRPSSSVLPSRDTTPLPVLAGLHSVVSISHCGLLQLPGVQGELVAALNRYTCPSICGAAQHRVTISHIKSVQPPITHWREAMLSLAKVGIHEAVHPDHGGQLWHTMSAA